MAELQAVLGLCNGVVYREFRVWAYFKAGSTRKKNATRRTVSDLSHAIKLVWATSRKGVTQAADRSTAEYSRTILSPESLITLNGNVGNNFATNNEQFENGLLNSDFRIYLFEKNILHFG